MRTEQEVYEELLQLESELECKLHDVKIAIRVLHGLKVTEVRPIPADPEPDYTRIAMDGALMFGKLNPPSPPPL